MAVIRFDRSDLFRLPAPSVGGRRLLLETDPSLAGGFALQEPTLTLGVTRQPSYRLNLKLNPVKPLRLNKIVHPDAEKPNTADDPNTTPRMRFGEGGYKITYVGNLPPGSGGVALTVGSTFYGIDITGGYNSGKTAQRDARLADLLDLIDLQGLWAQEVECRVFPLTWDRRDIRREYGSAPQMMKTPLEPFVGELSLQALGKEEYNYTCKARAPRLSMPINGRRYFVNASRFETRHPDRFGFDCTTYVISVYELSFTADLTDSNKVANAAGAKQCKLEKGWIVDRGWKTIVEESVVQVKEKGKLVDKKVKKKREEPDLEQLKADKPMEDVGWSYLRRFFTEDYAGGTYLVWKKGHIVVVEGDTVHEFNHHNGTEKFAPRGHRQTPLQQWLERYAGKGEIFWVRSLVTVPRKQIVRPVPEGSAAHSQLDSVAT